MIHRATAIRCLFSIALILGAVAATSLSTCAQMGWALPSNLSHSPSGVMATSMVADSAGRIHVAWSEDGTIYHRYQDGSGWSAPIRVAAGISPDLAADAGGRVYLAFVSRLSDNGDVCLAIWQGGAWGLPENVSQSPGISSLPRVAAAADGRLALVWVERMSDFQAIYFGQSTGGLGWSCWPVPNAQGTLPVVAFGPTGEPLVAWQEAFDEGLPMEVFVSQLLGGQWTLPVDVSASPLVDSALPALAVAEGGVCLAWEEAGAEGSMVYVAESADGRWSAPQKRSGADPAFAPSVTCDATGNGHLAWTTRDAVQYRPYAPLAGAWGAIETVAQSQGNPESVRLVAGAAVHAVWLAGPSVASRDVQYSRREAQQPPPPPIITRTATPTSTPTRPAVTATPAPAMDQHIFLPLTIRNAYHRTPGAVCL